MKLDLSTKSQLTEDAYREEQKANEIKTRRKNELNKAHDELKSKISKI